MERLNRILDHVTPSPAIRTADQEIRGSLASGTTGMLQGQVAIITGSGQGIGAAAAHLFAEQGACVVVSDLDADKSESVAASIREKGGQAISSPGDVTDPKFPERIISDTINKFGKLNILVNNAGYCWDGMLHKTTDKQWQAIMDCHTLAPFRLIRAAAPYMRIKSDEPRAIINVSSTSGLHGNVGQANYATAKLGVVGLTKTIAKEWGPFGVRCNAVAFGRIETRLVASKGESNFIEIDGKKIGLGVPKGAAEPSKQQLQMMIPLGRSGSPLEAAGSLLMLASPYSSYVSGICLECTGGFGI